MRFLNVTKDNVTFMSDDDSKTFKWYVNAAFAVHRDLKATTEKSCRLVMEQYDFDIKVLLYHRFNQAQGNTN
jgi:hypothetical protein